MPNITKPADMSSIWASAGNSVAPSAAKIAQGWVVELPPYQTANFISNKQDTFNAHINQHGVPVWDGVTEYQGGLSYTKGSNGIIYKAIATSVGLDPTNPSNSSSWVRAFEDFGSVAVVAANLASLDTQYRTLAGLSNVVTARNNLDVFSKTESDTRYALKNGASGQVFSVANATQPAHAIPLSQLDTLLVSATETVRGIAEIATNAEMIAGTDDERIVTPKKVSDNFLRRSNNLSDITNAAQARANLGITSIAGQPEELFVRVDSMVGQVATFARTTAPTGWLLCNGQAVSRTTYSALFAAIGTTYGAGNGSTTFNLPDCRNEFFRGWDGNTGVVGNKFSDSYAAHNHTASSGADGGHSHTASTNTTGSHAHSASTTDAGEHSHTIHDSNSEAFNYGIWYYGNRGGNLDNPNRNVTNSAGNHSHGVSVAANGNHSHTVSVSSIGHHTHPVTVNNSGGSETRPRGIYFLVCIRY